MHGCEVPAPAVPKAIALLPGTFFRPRRRLTPADATHGGLNELLRFWALIVFCWSLIICWVLSMFWVLSMS